MQILRVRCRSRKEFEDHYIADLPAGGMFCPTTSELSPGTPVVVELHCDGLPNRVLIRAHVAAWRPALPRLRIRAGATVEFDADEEPKRDFIIATLGGKTRPPTRRRHARIPVGLPVRFGLTELTLVEAELREIAVSGATLVAPIQPAIGEEVVMEIIPPGSAAAMTLSGRVKYHVGTDQTGIQFLYREGGGSRRLRELVRRFKVQ